MDVCAYSLDDLLRQLSNNIGADERRIVINQYFEAGAISNVGELFEQCFAGGNCLAFLRHEKPSESRCFRNFSMHFCLVRPIDPTANWSSLATSAYGLEGVSKKSISINFRQRGASTCMASR